MIFCISLRNPDAPETARYSESHKEFYVRAGSFAEAIEKAERAVAGFAVDSISKTDSDFIE